LDAGQWAQDWVSEIGVTVAQHPLDFADPYDDPSKLGGVRVEFDAENGLRADPERAISVAVLNNGKPVISPELYRFLGTMQRITSEMPRAPESERLF
jgi:hypothetical protein